MRSIPIFIVIFSCIAFAGRGTLGSARYSIQAKNLAEGKTEIAVRDASTTSVVYTIVLNDVYTSHVHPYEFRNGSLYVIRRTRGQDALWKYDKTKQGKLVYAVRGLDFAVSPNEKYLAVASGDSLLLMTSQGTVVHRCAASEFGCEWFKEVSFTDSSLIFVPDGVGYSFDGIVKMSLKDFTWNRFEIPGLSFDSEYDFNANNEMVVGSDYPFFYESSGYNDWVSTKPKIFLYLYDFVHAQTQVIDSSVAKKFNPKWLDNTRFQYDDPLSSKRVTRDIRH